MAKKDELAKKKVVRPTKMSKHAVDSKSQRINVQNRIRATFTGTRVFDRSLQKTNSWLKEMMEIMNWQNRERALSALRATLHALRDILPLHENIHLSAQLPILIRGLYFENWHYHPEPLRLSSVSEFYELVREKLGRGAGSYSTEEIRKFTRASFLILTEHVSAGEMYDIKGILRRNLRNLISVSFEELRQVDRAALAPARARRAASANVGKSPRRARKQLEDAKESRRRRTEVDNMLEHGDFH